MNPRSETAQTIPALPCACANLRRAARAVSRLYNRELRDAGLEITQYTILMTLHRKGEATQGDLGRSLALDSTTLTRTLKPLLERGWVAARSGDDRRERLLRLTASGTEKMRRTHAAWERAQKRFRRNLGEPAWSQMDELLVEVARVAMQG